MADLSALEAPERSFASDNTAGAHPDILDAVIAANAGHAAPYGEDPWTAKVEARFAELFDRPVETALVFGGTGGNVVALHTACTRDSLIVCTADAHIALDEAGAPEHITGAQLVPYPWDRHGKLTVEAVDDVAARLGRVHIHDTAPTPHIVSLTQATEVGTVYSPDELAAICDAAHRHGMLVHLDGARLANALVSAPWGYGPANLDQACQALAAAGVDIVVFGGTKAGLLGGEAVVFLDPAVAAGVAHRRKQATQTASKMRFLAAQFDAALSEGRILRWATDANVRACALATELNRVDGVELAYPTQTNAVFVTVPDGAIDALEPWTPFYTWDRPRNLIRFVTSWDTTAEDVRRLVAGVTAACTNQ